MSIVRLNEAALAAMGFDRSMIDALRHVVKQIGQETGGITLPELAEQTEDLGPVVDNLVILAAAAQAIFSTLEAEQVNLSVPNNDLARRLDDMQAAAERSDADRLALARAVSEMRDEFGAGYPSPIAETAATIKAKLGITTLSGSNTGDQTLAGLGGASYAEGTWTATLSSSGSPPTVPVTALCPYTKVGRMVTLHITFAAFSIAGATGNIVISGLPFPCASASAIAVCWAWNMGATAMIGRIGGGTSLMELISQTSNAGIPVTNGGGQYLYITASYLT